MTTQTEALDRLIDAVEAGADLALGDFYAVLGDGPEAPYMRSFEAHNGSLDAAKALHEALLPGWIFDVTNDSAFVMREINGLDNDHQYTGIHDTPARAWLLAILKAYRSTLD